MIFIATSAHSICVYEKERSPLGVLSQNASEFANYSRSVPHFTNTIFIRYINFRQRKRKHLHSVSCLTTEFLSSKVCTNSLKKAWPNVINEKKSEQMCFEKVSWKILFDVFISNNFMCQNYFIHFLNKRHIWIFELWSDREKKIAQFN